MKKTAQVKWLLLMAWRDSRRNRSRLFLFVSSIVLGIAALVAIHGLGENVRRDINQQAATLLGADLEIASNKEVSDSTLQLIHSLGNRQSEERYFASMIFFPKNGGTRLVQVRALQGEFPYYGSLETAPQHAGKAFRNKQAALVDKTLMLQYDLQPGDSVKVGDKIFAIEGSLLKAPGQTGLAASVAPAVYIPLHFLEQTGLAQKGSRINYRYYIQFDKPTNIDKLIKTLEPQLEHEGLRYDTIETQKEDSARAFNDISSFLSLVGFIALLLGCIGVASAIHIYVKEKVATIAILRCLGVKAKQAFLIYLVQIGIIGFLGAVAGAVIGAVVQQYLPLLLQDFLVIDIQPYLSWKAIFQGIAIGVVISFLFALLPLISLRRISPLQTLRISDDEHTAKPDKLKWLVYLLIGLFIYVFAWFQLGSWKESAWFTAGIVAAFLVLAGMAKLMMWLVRRFFPFRWNYLWRQGLANLYRPHNQTIILIVSIGLGTAFIGTLFTVQSLLLERVKFSASGNQPNMVLFDIQSQQKDSVAALARQYQLPVLQQVPIVNMRLEQLNGENISSQNNDSSISRRALIREYRVTYRDTLTSSEKITRGKWQSEVLPGQTIFISVEEGWAKRIKLSIGDTMVFNVQGVQLPTVIGSYRQVDWNRIQTNFLVVFPKGILESAPQFHVLLTRVSSDSASARFQQAMVQQFANVSIIDLGLVLKTLDDILQKIGYVIRFMAGFSIVTGLVVLIASVLISKYQRIQESVLLRTLGASRKQILAITALEYGFLGALAAFTGIILSIIASYALARFSFKMDFYLQPLPLLTLMTAICLLTIMIGLMNIRGILNKAPLEILRKET